MWGFYVLTRSMVISGQIPTCHSAHSWQHLQYCPTGRWGSGSMTTQWHYPDTELTNPFPAVVMPSANLGSNVCQSYKFDCRLWFKLISLNHSRTESLPHRKPSPQRLDHCVRYFIYVCDIYVAVCICVVCIYIVHMNKDTKSTLTATHPTVHPAIRAAVS